MKKKWKKTEKKGKNLKILKLQYISGETQKRWLKNNFKKQKESKI